MAELSRRAFLGSAAASGAGLVVGGVAGPLLGSWGRESPGPADLAAPAAAMHPFFGSHQAGVSTPPQAHICLAAWDMREGTDRRDLVRLLRDWSDAAARMTQGRPVGPSGALDGDPASSPNDTGEALELSASNLTLTIGFGPRLFDCDGIDRYGIGAFRPTELEALPSFVGDALKAAWSHGDLCVQACADDPQVAVHAVRNLARIGTLRARIRWLQMGFRSSPRRSGAPSPPRNLFGFKDGTSNIPGDDLEALAEHVWIPPTSNPAWLAGGTYLVVRKIEMLIEGWDREPLAHQEAVFGRSKGTGAPLSGGEEFAAPDFTAMVEGNEAIDPRSHIRLAHPSNHGGIRILRRGYNYNDASRAGGRLNAGLLFVSYQRSPGQFIRIQRALADDLLNDYVRPIGSAIFAVPPGASEGGFVGETLLA